MKKTHIFGASGSGTSTLGEALANELLYSHLDPGYFVATVSEHTEQQIHQYIRARDKYAHLALQDNIKYCQKKK